MNDRPQPYVGGMLPHLPRRAVSFLLLAFGISWGLVAVGYAFGVRQAAGMGYIVVAALCMLGPAIAAIIQQRIIDRAPWGGLGLAFKPIRWKYMLLTALIGACIFPLALLVAYVAGKGMGFITFGSVEVTQQRMLTSIGEVIAASGLPEDANPLFVMLRNMEIPGAVLLIGFQFIAILAACSVNLPMMLGEELGWRGYLYGATSSWPVLPRVLFTGVVWGLWHAPLIAMGHNYPEHPLLGIPLMVVFCVFMALLFDWARTRTRAVWGPCMLHGIINGSAGAYVLFAWEGHSLVNSPAGLAGMLALGILGLLVLVFDSRYRQALFVPGLDQLHTSTASTDPTGSRLITSDGFQADDPLQ